MTAGLESVLETLFQTEGENRFSADGRHPGSIESAEIPDEARLGNGLNVIELHKGFLEKSIL